MEFRMIWVALGIGMGLLLGISVWLYLVQRINVTIDRWLDEE